MFRRSMIPAWVGILALSGMFLVGQDTWAPQTCVDNDGDGYGSPASTACTYPALDCDDTNSHVNPGVVEGPFRDATCQDGIDNDCDGLIDIDDTGCQECPPGNCDDGNPCTIDSCEGHVCVNTNVTDGWVCDDGDACTVSNACTEGVCSGILLDSDGDGYAPRSCGGADCDDTNADVYPGASEICDNGIDDNCNDLIDNVDPSCTGVSSNLPDTGQDQCYDNTAQIECPAPGADFYGQDANYEINPMSYTYVFGGLTVTDNVTGLVWQRCSNGLRGSDCSVGSAEENDWFAASIYCEHLDLGGYTDWRLPNEYALDTIVDHGRSDPAIDTAAFPGTVDTVSNWYWSASLYLDSYYAIGVSFNNGYVDSYVMGYTGYVRCVRGKSKPQTFKDNLDGTVTDDRTGLMWQQQSDVGRTWQDSLRYCEDLVLPVGGYSDWRLPDVKELNTIVNYRAYNPAINVTTFPGTIGAGYWSSSTFSNNGHKAWVVDFLGGTVFYYGNKADARPVRCVR